MNEVKEPTYAIKMITGWRGKIDGEERTVKAGEQVNVDIATARALVFQHGKATLVSTEELIAQSKPKAKPSGQRASKKGPKRPPKDKQQTASNVK